MADLIDNTRVAELWMSTADLGTARPWGIASSPDGNTLYVSCVGNPTTTGKVLAINIKTKAITTIVSGVSILKQSLDVDADGNLYFAFGPNHSANAFDLKRWDGSSITNHFPASFGHNYWGLTIDDIGNAWYGEYPNQGYRLAQRTLGGTKNLISYTQPGLGGETDVLEQGRGIIITANYVLVMHARHPAIRRYMRWQVQNDNYHTGEIPSAGAGFTGYDARLTGGFAVSDTETYLLSQEGLICRYNIVANTQSWMDFSSRGMPRQMPNEIGMSAGGFGDIHLTSKGRCFVTCGGWNAPPTDDAGGRDDPRGIDRGIYEIILDKEIPWLRMRQRDDVVRVPGVGYGSVLRSQQESIRAGNRNNYL